MKVVKADILSISLVLSLVALVISTSSFISILLVDYRYEESYDRINALNRAVQRCYNELECVNNTTLVCYVDNASLCVYLSFESLLHHDYEQVNKLTRKGYRNICQFMDDLYYKL